MERRFGGIFHHNLRMDPLRTLTRSALAAGLFVSSLGALWSLHHIKHLAAHENEGAREVLYLPSGRALEGLSFGYRNVLGHLLWFGTISYFGKHFASDRNYDWLNHRCGLVTTLIPRALYAYQFCSNMLSWEANAPTQSAEILTKGLAHLPDDWHLHFYRGMTYLYFLNDPERARDDFVVAAKSAEAPVVLKRLAAKTMAELNDRDAAITLLETLISEERDASASKVLRDRLNDLKRGAAAK